MLERGKKVLFRMTLSLPTAGLLNINALCKASLEEGWEGETKCHCSIRQKICTKFSFPAGKSGYCNHVTNCLSWHIIFWTNWNMHKSYESRDWVSPGEMFMNPCLWTPVMSTTIYKKRNFTISSRKIEDPLIKTFLYFLWNFFHYFDWIFLVFFIFKF